MDEYLSVRDVALLVRRSEETIRRLIRAGRISYRLAGNGSRQGYLIPASEVVRIWDISPEEVAAFIEYRAAHPDEDERRPLGPDRPDIDIDAALQNVARFSGAITDMIKTTVRQFTDTLERGAQGGTGAYGADNTGGTNGMNDNNFRDDINTNDTNPTPEYGDERTDEAQGRPEWTMPDFSAAGERVGAMLGDAFRQIRNAVNQAGAAFSAAINQAQDNAQSASAETYGAGEQAAPSSNDAAAETAFDAQETAREERQERESIIRDAIARSREIIGGESKRVPYVAPEVCTEAAEAATDKPDGPTVRVVLEKPDTEPAAAPEPAAQPQPEPPVSDKPEDILHRINTADENESFRLLQEARAAVKRSIESEQTTAVEPTVQPAEPIQQPVEAVETVEADVTSDDEDDASVVEITVTAEVEPAGSMTSEQEEALTKRVQELEAKLRELNDLIKGSK